MSYTYADLKTTVKTVTKRSALADATIQEMLRQAEAVINRDVRSDEMIQETTLTDADRASVGSPEYNLPARFVEIDSLQGTLSGQPYQLTGVGSQELYKYATTNDPLWYTIHGGDHLIIRGTPPTDAEYTLNWYRSLAELSDDADTNNVLLYHRDVYISGTLHFLYLYLEDLDMADYYGVKFKNCIDRLNQHATRTRKGKTAPSGNLGIFYAGSSM